MKPFSQPELDIAQSLIELIKTEKQSTQASVSSESNIRIADFIFQSWSKRLGSASTTIAPRSLELRSSPSVQPIIDFPVPPAFLSNKLLSLDQKDYRAPYICDLLHHYASFCLISPNEKDKLSAAGLAESMPSDWIQGDRFVRYALMKINMGEANILPKEQMRSALTNPHCPYYVYRLWTPSDKVFYIGKGDKLRALSHEKEIYSPNFSAHTNWKKLNKIAQILHSGGAIKYEIESWHREEQQALLREEELICTTERASPHILCNSNNHRWAGKPSESLLALRRLSGLQPNE